jgi:hypothetical protein
MMKCTAMMCLVLTGCGTNSFRSNQVVSFNTKPQGCEVFVYEPDRKLIYQGVTPCRISLPRQNGYYSPANYSIEFKKKGFFTKECPLISQMEDSDLWLISTVTVLPAFLRLVSQPAKKSLYCLPENVNVSMQHK